MNRREGVNNMQSLQFLIGEWQTEGNILQDGVIISTFRGTDSYEWILRGHFIQHKVDVLMPDGRVEGLEVIGGFLPAMGHYAMRSFDNTGTFIEMQGELISDGTFRITGDRMRAELSVVSAGRMEARWEKSEDNKSWAAWMNVTLTAK